MLHSFLNFSDAHKDAPGIPSRQVTLEILYGVLEKKHSLDICLEQNRMMASLSSRDRAFARLSILSVLRHLGQLNAFIDTYLREDFALTGGAASGGKLIPYILQIGLAQLLFIGTPAHAVVDSCVRLSEGLNLRKYTRLVNAVLRRAAREASSMAEQQDAAFLNTPAWLWESWCRHYGRVNARAIAEAHMRPPCLDLSVPLAFCHEMASAHNAILLPSGAQAQDCTIRLGTGGGDVRNLAGYEEGHWWVQDVASAMPVRLLGNVRGLSVIDLCAAPGGKTLQLIKAGAQVRAVDRSASRLRRLHENLERGKVCAEIICADAEKWRADKLFDIVLLDAPCSATGTLRRHPDIAYSKGQDDVNQLASLQSRLLRAALHMVRPGGIILYANCSLQPEEGEEQAQRFLTDCADQIILSRIEMEEIAPFHRGVTPEGFFRSLPCFFHEQGGCDGFFAARFIRKG